MTGRPIHHLFVYGTLRPGEARWHHLSRFVVDEGTEDTVSGSLFDTGQGYPAAVFGNTGTIVGRTYPLLETTMDQALDHLDDVEGAVRGLYRRVVVTCSSGRRAFAYEYGGGLPLTPIPSGDWLAR